MEQNILFFMTIIKNVIHNKCDYDLSSWCNWNYLVQLAREHNLLALFVEGASKYYSFISRPEYEKEMNESIAIVSAQVRRTSAFLKLYEAFLAADLHPIVMKGLICRELYGALGDHRPSGDEDILIHPSEYELAKHILTANGYISEIEKGSDLQMACLQEISFIHPKERLHIELHLNPMGRGTEAHSRMSDYFKRVFEEYREVEINGVSVRTMTHQEHLCFLILHAFKHFTMGGFGIRQMLDILLYQEKYGSEIDIKTIKEVLQSFGADVFWNDMIHIGNLYLGFCLPTLLEANCPIELLEDMVMCGAFGNKTQAERTATHATIAATEREKNRNNSNNSNMLTIIWKSIFPSKSHLVNHNPSLQEKPWLLPIEWLKRWGRFIQHNSNHDGSLAIESMKISRRRMKLLKKYDLV